MNRDTRDLVRLTVLVLPWLAAGSVLLADEPPAARTSIVSGRELFLREWVRDDPRSHGGDGLGPLFNDTSCVACHNQGGPGGGGSEAKNVILMSAVRNLSPEETQEVVQRQRSKQRVPANHQRSENPNRS